MGMPGELATGSKWPKLFHFSLLALRTVRTPHENSIAILSSATPIGTSRARRAANRLRILSYRSSVFAWRSAVAASAPCAFPSPALRYRRCKSKSMDSSSTRREFEGAVRLDQLASPRELQDLPEPKVDVRPIHRLAEILRHQRIARSSGQLLDLGQVSFAEPADSIRVVRHAVLDLLPQVLRQVRVVLT